MEVTMKRHVSMFRRYCFVGAIIFLSLFLTHCSSEHKGPVFIQEPLPYAQNALEPYMSAKTLSFHYGIHHAAYVKNANKLMTESGVKGETPKEVIVNASKKEKYHSLFNQAAQAWNHGFFWKCLNPHGGGQPTGDLLQKIDKAFGGMEPFKAQFIAAGKSVFGSGWVWLVADKHGELSIMTTANADTPVAHGMSPLFGVDVWEHSYYLDYQNKRDDYLKAVLDHLADWNFAAAQLGDLELSH